MSPVPRRDAVDDDVEEAPATPAAMMPLAAVVRELEEKGMQPDVLPPPSFREKYRDRSLAIVCPTRGTIATKVVEQWPYLAWPMNQRRHGPSFAEGYRVDLAYERFVRMLLGHPVLRDYRYVMSIEDDNLIPHDAPLRLLETLEAGPEGDGSSEWDAVGGIYFTKDHHHQPMAYGDPVEFRRTGVSDYRPVDVKAIDLSRCSDRCRGKLDGCGHVLECVGIAMGCTIWKMDLFREIEPPWFETFEDRVTLRGELKHPHDANLVLQEDPTDPLNVGKKIGTQDIAFCEKAVRRGKRFAIDLRCAVGHLDVRTSRVW